MLELQTLVGNRATTAFLQRVLTAPQQQQLVTRTQQLSARLDQLVGRIPAEVRAGWGGDEFPVADVVRTVNQEANANAAAATQAALDGRLDGAESEIQRLEQYVGAHQPAFDDLARLYGTFAPLAGEAEVKAELAPIARRFFRGQRSVTEFQRFVAKLQRLKIPSNKAMQALRARDAGAAMNTVAQLVQAGLVDLGDHEDFYESPFDRDDDHFGASWSLSPRTASGASQWLREWEFHVHAKATRTMGPAPVGTRTAITGFEINRAHIKPSKDRRATAVSIQITDPQVLSAAVNIALEKFLRWADSTKGVEALRGKKRA